MAKMKILSDYTFKKGVHDDDSLYQHMRDLNHITEKPLKDNGDVDELSYQTVVNKKIRIVVYVES